MKEKERIWIPKTWGGEDIIFNSPLYCGKRLIFVKNKRLSVHFHKIKNETFYLNEGKVELKYYDDPEIDKLINCWQDLDNLNIETIIMNPSDSFDIPVGRRHTLKALEDSVVIEFSTQDFTDDSFRILKSDAQ